MSRLRELAEVVAPRVIEDAIEIGELLSRLGIRHTLIGGLAVGLNGFPRATKDVDYLVGSEAFASTTPLLVYRPELSERVRLGDIDLLAVPEAFPFLESQLTVAKVGEVPVMAPEALIVMKLAAHRPQDRADVLHLLNSGVSPEEVAAFLSEYAPQLLDRFTQLVEPL